MPDRLKAEELTRPRALLGHAVLVKQITGSTNDDAMELARGGAPAGTVVITETQQKGRGRMGRAWHSPAGVNLLFSVILRGERMARTPGLTTIAAGVAVAEAVKRLTGLPARIKWPNDVRVHGKKIAGLLAEAGGEGGIEHIVLGVGLNVNLKADDLPPELREIASSILIETGGEWSRAELFKAVLEGLEEAFGLIERGEPEAVLARWAGLSEVAGRRVRVETPGGEVSGEALGVREDGALLIREGDQIRAVIAGDAHFVD